MKQKNRRKKCDLCTIENGKTTRLCKSNDDDNELVAPEINNMLANATEEIYTDRNNSHSLKIILKEKMMKIFSQHDEKPRTLSDIQGITNNIFLGYPNGLVTVNHQNLPARPDLNPMHSDKYAWGYAGSGPEYLALAILAWELPESDALKHYQRFKLEIISDLPFQEHWILNGHEIYTWLFGLALDKPLDSIK